MNAIDDYRSSTSATYNDLLASVCRNRPYGADDEISECDCWFGLFHFRRCSTVVFVDSQGFWSSAGEMAADEAAAEFDRISDSIAADIDAACWEECPDRWEVQVPHLYQHAYRHVFTTTGPDDNAAEIEARVELAGILRRVRAVGLVLLRIGDGRYEAVDREDAATVSDYVGVYSIKFVDLEDERDYRRCI